MGLRDNILILHSNQLVLHTHSTTISFHILQKVGYVKTLYLYYLVHMTWYTTAWRDDITEKSPSKRLQSAVFYPNKIIVFLELSDLYN
jgi:hypothetical protein